MQGLLICKNLLTNILSQEGLILEPNAIVLEKCLHQRGIKTTQECQDFNYCDLIIFGGEKLLQSLFVLLIFPHLKKMKFAFLW